MLAFRGGRQMKYVIGGFTAFALGLVAIWVTRARNSRNRWTLLSGWET